ncbi:hypothetical protein [Natronorubrum tibetense]|uniref:Mn2+/Fe2+ transporter n=1 Tax=Natronorubrum tibetense GA33 TaxID=1114856 RepID=L9VFV2_9EURY|nr:hypothetical protein [Natronorubrum tibetense]ELY35931.1 hypothetical protein C496_22419 [Natronorubrum tibetense GA33]
MPSTGESIVDGGLVIAVIALTFAIGLSGAALTESMGVAVTWVWIGIGLAITYLLYKLVLAVEQLGGEF